MTAPRLTLRLREVAEQTGASLTTVKGWVASGELPSVRPSGKPGGVVLVKPADLEAFLDRHREGRHLAPVRAARGTRPARTA